MTVWRAMQLRRTPRFLSISLALVCASALCGTGEAAAAPISIGQIAPPTQSCNSTTGGYTYTQNAVEAGTSYVVPTDGAIIEWSTQGNATYPLPNAKLKVVRLSEGGAKMTVVGESDVGLLDSGQIGTFPVEIPVQAGDQLGFYPGGEGLCSISSGVSGDAAVFGMGDLALGALTETHPLGGFKIPVSAVVLPRPVVSSVSPVNGATAGGATVAIQGEDLQRIESVSFGGVPATSFSEVSETQTTAVVPAGAAGTVDVQVTTVAGQSPAVAADQFTFLAPAPPVETPAPATPLSAPPTPTRVAKCVVPNLKGKNLKAARKRAKSAGCAVGRVKKLAGAKSATGRVTVQRPTAGKTLAAGSKILVTLK
jgi:hypothetical protein